MSVSVDQTEKIEVMMKIFLLQIAILTGICTHALAQTDITQPSHPMTNPGSVEDEWQSSATYLAYNAIRRQVASNSITRKRGSAQSENNYEVNAVLFQSDSLTSRHEEDDANKNISPFKKTVFTVLSIITFIGFIALIVIFAKKFR